MISHEKKFVFVQIPKTATTSICKALYRFRNPDGLPPHATIHEIREAIGEERYRTYFKFAIHRDETERMEAVHAHEINLHKGNRMNGRMYEPESFFIDDTVKMYSSAVVYFVMEILAYFVLRKKEEC